jgi:hypothetical protein
MTSMLVDTWSNRAPQTRQKDIHGACGARFVAWWLLVFAFGLLAPAKGQASHV